VNFLLYFLFYDRVRFVERSRASSHISQSLQATSQVDCFVELQNTIISDRAINSFLDGHACNICRITGCVGDEYQPSNLDGFDEHRDGVLVTWLGIPNVRKFNTRFAYQ
jgi:hypothetical protein